MKIAVLGATGMIGHHTARAVIQQGHELVVIHRPSSKLTRLADLRFTARSAQLDDPASLTQALQGLDAIIHCAAYYPTLPRPWREEVHHALTQMENFYLACEQAHLKKIVYLGAAIALRKHPNGLPGHEGLEYPSSPPNKNPYLQVKWAMDHQAVMKARAGLPVCIGIPSMTFGEFDYGPSTGRIITGIASGLMTSYVRGKRNVIYAGDGGRGLLQVCESGQPGERYLLTGENIDMDHLVQTIASKAAVAPPKPIPLYAAKLTSTLQILKYRYAGGPPPTVSETMIAVMSAGQHLNGDKARKELGFTATVSVDEAIERALAWFRQVGYIKPR